MAQSWQLAPILARRQMLTAESDRLRERVGVELMTLETAANWIDKGVLITQSFRSWWPVLAGLLGLVLGRTRGRALGKLGKLWSLWGIIRKAMTIWHQYFSSPADQKEPT